MFLILSLKKCRLAVNVLYVHMQLSEQPIFGAKMASGDISDLTYDQILYVLSLCIVSFPFLSLSLQAEIIMNYHVGETVLSLQKTTLIPGGSESLVYTTLSGGIGILVPFTSHEVKH